MQDGIVGTRMLCCGCDGNQIESNRVELDYSNIHGEISAGCSLLA